MTLSGSLPMSFWMVQYLLTSQRSLHECWSVLCQVLHEEEGVLDSILVECPALRIRETAIIQDTERKCTSRLGTFHLGFPKKNMKEAQGSSGQEPLPNS